MSDNNTTNNLITNPIDNNSQLSTSLITSPSINLPDPPNTNQLSSISSTPSNPFLISHSESDISTMDENNLNFFLTSENKYNNPLTGTTPTHITTSTNTTSTTSNLYQDTINLLFERYHSELASYNYIDLIFNYKYTQNQPSTNTKKTNNVNNFSFLLQTDDSLHYESNYIDTNDIFKITPLPKDRPYYVKPQSHFIMNWIEPIYTNDNTHFTLSGKQINIELNRLNFFTNTFHIVIYIDHSDHYNLSIRKFDNNKNLQNTTLHDIEHNLYNNDTTHNQLNNNYSDSDTEFDSDITTTYDNNTGSDNIIDIDNELEYNDTKPNNNSKTSHKHYNSNQHTNHIFRNLCQISTNIRQYDENSASTPILIPTTLKTDILHADIDNLIDTYNLILSNLRYLFSNNKFQHPSINTPTTERTDIISELNKYIHMDIIEAIITIVESPITYVRKHTLHTRFLDLINYADECIPLIKGITNNTINNMNDKYHRSYTKTTNTINKTNTALNTINNLEFDHDNHNNNSSNIQKHFKIIKISQPSLIDEEHFYKYKEDNITHMRKTLEKENNNLNDLNTNTPSIAKYILINQLVNEINKIAKLQLSSPINNTDNHSYVKLFKNALYVIFKTNFHNRLALDIAKRKAEINRKELEHKKLNDSLCISNDTIEDDITTLSNNHDTLTNHTSTIQDAFKQTAQIIHNEHLNVEADTVVSNSLNTLKMPLTPTQASLPNTSSSTLPTVTASPIITTTTVVTHTPTKSTQPKRFHLQLTPHQQHQQHHQQLHSEQRQYYTPQRQFRTPQRQSHTPQHQHQHHHHHHRQQQRNPQQHRQHKPTNTPTHHQNTDHTTPKTLPTIAPIVITPHHNNSVVNTNTKDTYTTINNQKISLDTHIHTPVQRKLSSKSFTTSPKSTLDRSSPATPNHSKPKRVNNRNYNQVQRSPYQLRSRVQQHPYRN